MYDWPRRILLFIICLFTAFACASEPTPEKTQLNQLDCPCLEEAVDDEVKSRTPIEPVTPFVVDSDEAMLRVNDSQTISAYVYGEGLNAAVARLLFEPNTSIQRHRDWTEQYLYVLTGHGVITINEREYDVQPHSLIFVPANALVSFENGDEPFVGVQIYAGPGPIEKYRQWPDTQEVDDEEDTDLK